MNRLEDFLSPPKLVARRDEFIQEIDAIIDDGGISGQPLSIDEIMELESRNYPNIGYEFEEFSKAEIEEERLLSELGFKDWVRGIEDEEHYVDHDVFELEDPRLREDFITDEKTDAVFKIIGPAMDQFFEDHKTFDESELPDYLLNDPEIVGYPDRVTQHQIYDWVKTKLQYNNFSIKDLGCGRGDFGNWLDGSFEYGGDEGEISPEIDYFGIDNNPNLIQVGQKKYPKLKLINSDFNDVSIQTDFTICIGTLNDDHDLDKWMMFNKTLNHALNNTKTAILFVLQANCYGIEGHLDYPLHELVQNLSEGIRFEIDYSKLEDIYLLTVHIGGYNN